MSQMQAPAACMRKELIRSMLNPVMLQTLLEAFSAALAATTRPPLVARLRDGVFGELAAAAGSARAFAALDMGALGADLFALGAPCVPCSAGGRLFRDVV